MYIYEFDYLGDKDYKIGYELVASNDLSFKFGMDFEATNDLDYLKDEEYIEVSDNIVKKLKSLMSEANRAHVIDIFKYN